MTRRLVDNEWDVLEHLDGRLSTPVVPRPMLRLDWGPLRVVVTAPLPSDGRRLEGTSHRRGARGDDRPRRRDDGAA